jgi:hypothetical protein
MEVRCWKLLEDKEEEGRAGEGRARDSIIKFQ